MTIPTSPSEITPESVTDLIRSFHPDASVGGVEVPEVWKAVTSVFRDYGYRRLRTRARLKFLIADWGVEKFREVVETEYLNRSFIDLDAPEAPETPADHVGVFRQKDGKFFIGAAPTVGRISGTLLNQLADIVEAHGSDRVRTTPMQKLLVLDVDEDQVVEQIPPAS